MLGLASLQPTPPRHSPHASTGFGIILELLGDGMPRSRRAFVAALADRYPKEEVELTLMRLAVTGQISAASGKYTLPQVTEPQQS